MRKKLGSNLEGLQCVYYTSQPIRNSSNILADEDALYLIVGVGDIAQKNIVIEPYTTNGVSVDICASASLKFVKSGGVVALRDGSDGSRKFGCVVYKIKPN